MTAESVAFRSAAARSPFGRQIVSLETEYYPGMLSELSGLSAVTGFPGDSSRIALPHSPPTEGQHVFPGFERRHIPDAEHDDGQQQTKLASAITGDSSSSAPLTGATLGVSGGKNCKLAIFDLDNTLLNGDSDYGWGCFLADRGIVDPAEYRRMNQVFYQQYEAGTLNIYEFLEFAFKPLAENKLADLLTLREEFMRECVESMILPKAGGLIADHRNRDHILLIITSTNRFVTEPIAGRLGIEHLLATDPEMHDNAYTGKISGIPCFREGKITRLRQWLTERQLNPTESWFYSDSHNDLPLLQQVDHPVAVDPDPVLLDYARQQGWSVISLR